VKWWSVPREALFAETVVVESPVWLGSPAQAGDQLGVQMRHRAREVAARIRAVDETSVTLDLAAPQLAVTPGQSAVLFEGDRVLGGGRIGRQRGAAAPVLAIS
jgi:tRNA-specific 2-thiouridylase